MSSAYYRSPRVVAVVMTIAFATSLAGAKPLALIIAPQKQNRRFIVAEYVVAANPPFSIKDAQTSQSMPCQWEKTEKGYLVRWVVPFLAADQAGKYILDESAAERDSSSAIQPLSLRDDASGFVAIRSGDSEITRYYYKPAHNKHQKPYFYPLIVRGVAITRASPMERKAGEDTDHPHHTSIYFAHGEVNGTDYWSKAPIVHKRFIEKSAGPVGAHIVAEDAWGKDLTETQDVLIFEAGGDVIMDWTITLTADIPVELGKTKEGGFAVRVAQPLVDKSGGRMIDADGNKGENPIRAHAAVWADDYGVIDGKTVGVCIMNHPKSWRFPTNWHVRGYGLFAANAFFVQGEQRLAKGESITLKYRLYCHGGDPVEAKVNEVYAGYATPAVVAQ